ncbi:MAG TPA: hypothetical protein VKA70_20415 [Blastocatellia bacterium]|nr:hypothetical protein [Blastocatellia bacterium]
MSRRIVSACLLCLIVAAQASPCTIISGRAKDGSVWVGNNEDWSFDFETYLNVLPREGNLFGAITFTYAAPDTPTQGGVNEKGLFYDFNSVPFAPDSDYEGRDIKKDFPGGDEAFCLHILRRCSTVKDVLELLKRYRVSFLVEAQMHLADRQGNLAIVNADSVLLSRGESQVSTNFNVGTKANSPDAKTCWRFPIAERLIRERGAGLDNFREILDATQQYRYFSTIYSNIVNLSTGDIYFYYAGDFQKAVHIKLGELLSEGKRSYPIRSLFPDAPIVKVWDAYRAQGAEKAVELFRQLEGGMPEKRRSEVLRHIFLSCLLTTSKYADSMIFFDEWERVNRGLDEAASFYGAFVRLSNGGYEKGKELLARQVKVDATDERAQRGYPQRAARLLARLEGAKPEGANARFELKGHKDAKFVSLYLPNRPPVFYFLLKTDDGWAGDFKMPEGEIYYSFMVDGKMMLDPSNPRSEEYAGEDGKLRLNVKIVK